MFPIPWNKEYRKKDGTLVKINDAINGGSSNIPPHSSSDAGKVLTVGDDGSLEWDESGSGGGVLYGPLPPSDDAGNNGDYYLQLKAYLNSDGTQTLNTGILASNVFGIKVIFHPISLAAQYQSYVSARLDDFTIGANGSLDSAYLRTRNTERGRYITSTSQDTEIMYSSLDSFSEDATNTIRIFGNPEETRLSAMALRYLALYDSSEEKIAEYMPVMHNNVPSLYDAVNDTYLSNQTLQYALTNKVETVWYKNNNTWGIWTV